MSRDRHYRGLRCDEEEVGEECLVCQRYSPLAGLQGRSGDHGIVVAEPERSWIDRRQGCMLDIQKNTLLLERHTTAELAPLVPVGTVMDCMIADLQESGALAVDVGSRRESPFSMLFAGVMRLDCSTACNGHAATNSCFAASVLE
jgi:hypothetical protein